MRTTLTEPASPSLALAVVSGQPLQGCAAEHGRDDGIIRETAQPADVAELIPACSAQIRERALAWLESLSPPAVGQFFELAARIARPDGKLPRRRPRRKARREGAIERRVARRIAKLERRLARARKADVIE